MSYEEIIADEIVDGLEFPRTEGWLEFDKTIELDDDTVVEVAGSIEYETAYEESTNYYYNTFISTDISDVIIHSEKWLNISRSKLVKHINQKLLRI